MVLSTTNSAGSKWTIYSGTAQEVLDALDSHPHGGVQGFHTDGTTYYALVMGT